MQTYERGRVSTGRGLTRRRVLGATAGASAAALLAAACGGDSDGDAPAASGVQATQGPASTAAAQAAPKRGGSLSTAVSNDPNSLDLHMDPNVWPQLGSAYSKVLKQGPKGVVPDLATAMPEQPDPQTIIITLRQGVTFHNAEPVGGRALRAEDVKYSLDRVGTNDPKFQSRRFVEVIDRVEVVDPTHIKVSLKQPFAPQVTYLAFPTLVIVPREAVEKSGDLRTGPVIGSGPFVSTEIRPGVEYVNKRNERYFEDGKPYIDEVRVRVIPDAGTRLAQLRSNSINYLSAVSLDEYNQVKRSLPDAGAEKTATQRYRTAINTQVAPFRDARVRQAVHLATDREEIIALMAGGEGLAYGTLPDYFPGALSAKDLQGKPGYRTDKRQDIAEARQLLTAAGFPNGLEIPAYLSLKLARVPEAVTAHVEQLKRAGINATIQPVEYADWTQRMLKHDYAISGAVTSMRLDPDDHFYTEVHSKGPRNDGNLQDAEIDRLIDRQRAVANEQERIRIWRELEEKLLVALPYVPLFIDVNYLVWQKGWQGLTADGGKVNYIGHMFSDVWRDQ